MEGCIPKPVFSSQIVCNDYLKITAPGLPDDIQKLSFQESFLNIKQLKGIFSKPQLCKAEPISGRGKLKFQVFPGIWAGDNQSNHVSRGCIFGVRIQNIVMIVLGFAGKFLFLKGNLIEQQNFFCLFQGSWNHLRIWENIHSLYTNSVAYLEAEGKENKNFILSLSSW